MCYVILFADNKTDYRNMWEQYLRLAGYEVILADGPTAAAKALSERRVHLAVLDLRLEDDDDSGDISGLKLAKKFAHDGVPKIIMTRYPSYEHVREALGPTVDGLPPTVDFINKVTSSEDDILAAMALALQTHAPMNKNLRVDFHPSLKLSWPGLVGQVDQKLPTAMLPDRVGEFKDLFRKLFMKEEQVTIRQLFWERGEHMALEALVYEQGREEQYIVTCGQLEVMRAEKNTYRAHIPKSTGSGMLNLHLQAETPHYGALAGAIQRAEGVGEDLKPFPAYYRAHTEKQATALLDKLADATIKPWHTAETDLLEGQTLRDWYCARAGLKPEDFDGEDWQRRLSLLARDCQRAGLPQTRGAGGRIHLDLPSGRPLELADPFPFFCDAARLQTERAPVGFSLGELEIDTLLTDRLGNAWFSDYCRAGRAPVWHDFIAMETSLRFSLAEGAGLLELANLERRLASAARLGEPVSLADIDPDLRKLAACIQAVRAQAAEVTGPDLAPYLACLAYACMDDLLRYDPGRRLSLPELTAHLYRLVTAALACERAEKLRGGRAESGAAPGATLPAAGRLVIDPANRSARVDGREVALSPTEFDLLRYLHAHAGQVCRRDDILREVFGITASHSEQEESQINTNISRLRGKVEQDADNPSLILTVRGLGFKLVDG